MTGLVRDPAEWARESGWISRVRAERAALRCLRLAELIDGALNIEEDETAGDWCQELKSLAAYLAPKQNDRRPRHPGKDTPRTPDKENDRC